MRDDCLVGGRGVEEGGGVGLGGCGLGGCGGNGLLGECLDDEPGLGDTTKICISCESHQKTSTPPFSNGSKVMESLYKFII